MPHILKNSIELDLKTKLIESGTTQTEIAEKLGVTLFTTTFYVVKHAS